MRRRDWILSVLCWDGCLPLLIAALGSLLVRLFQRDLAELMLTVFVPIVAALWRANRGYHQLRHRNLPASFFRQLLFSGAIVCLLLLEAIVGKVQVHRDAPAEVLLVVAAVYVVYLALIIPALWPGRPRPMPNGKT